MNVLKREPAIVTGVAVSILVALAAAFDVVLDEDSVEAAVAPLIAAILIRPRVTPTHE